jgi:NAD(P)-dependent dehydrogenase (short-subunit alcohol dehydrogenase family)
VPAAGVRRRCDGAAGTVAGAVTDAAQLLRAGLLEGVAVALADPVRPAIARPLARLGAELRPVGADAVEPGDGAPPAVAAPVDALVVDAAARFAAADAAADRLAPLRAALDGTWAAARAVADAAWIGPGRPGRLVLLAPEPTAGPHAAAAADALENLARTLSIEWARFGIRTVAIAPGGRTSADELAALVAYLLSPAGDYVSGCRLDVA